MRHEIDINQWERKEHFEFYSQIATPHYCVAFNIDYTFGILKVSPKEVTINGVVDSLIYTGKEQTYKGSDYQSVNGLIDGHFIASIEYEEVTTKNYNLTGLDLNITSVNASQFLNADF